MNLYDSVDDLNSLTCYPAGQLNSVAEALLLFIDSLAEPVVPYPFYAKCLDCCSNFTLCKQVSQYFPFILWFIPYYFHYSFPLYTTPDLLQPLKWANFSHEWRIGTIPIDYWSTVVAQGEEAGQLCPLACISIFCWAFRWFKEKNIINQS